MSCPIATLHASRDLERGGDCDCAHCSDCCACLDDALDDALFDADELGLDPEHDDLRRYPSGHYRPDLEG